MGELEDKISQVLSSPEEMEKLMQMARTLSGSLGMQTPSAESPPAGGGSPFSGLDPQLLEKVTRLMASYNDPAHDKTQLLQAIRPYLRPSRQEAVDKASQMTKLANVARLAMQEFSGERGDAG